MADDETRPDALSAEDQEYLRAQGGSVGSGALGGWSQSAFGGQVDGDPKRTVAKVRAELHAIVSQTPEPLPPRG
jgi:hypothetical protein